MDTLGPRCIRFVQIRHVFQISLAFSDGNFTISVDFQGPNSVREYEKSVLNASITILSKLSSRLYGSTIFDVVIVTISFRILQEFEWKMQLEKRCAPEAITD